MWNKLHLGSFKAFREVDVELGPLTVLAGINSAGKSSVLQAMALLNQTILDNRLNQHLCLSGFNFALGTVDDVANHNYSRKRFEIGLRNEYAELTWEAMSLNREDSLQARIASVTMRAQELEQRWEPTPDGIVKLLQLCPEDWHSLSLMPNFCREIERIKYLSSERLGPRDAYPVLSNSELRTVGPQGQFCASFIYLFGDEDAQIPSAIGTKTTIKKLIDEFTDSFFPGYTPEPRRIDHSNLMSLLVFDPSNDLHRIQSVGFGISHALPIITQCAGALPGDTLLIENPESQLHPSAQSKMGQFLAITASYGIQVVVETHSDHILNGIRRSVASRQIPASDVCINFVSRNGEAMQPTYERIHLTPEGRLNSWPQGFFDQIEEDLISLP